MLNRKWLNITIIQKIKDLPEQYKTEQVFEAAVKIMLNENLLYGTNASDSSGVEILEPLLTQSGCEWYQEQIKNKKPKWQKLFKYVGKRLLDKGIDSII